MLLNFGVETKVTRVANDVAGATPDSNSTSVDMELFDAVAFLVLFGAITATAVTSCKLQQSSDDGVADTWADLTGTSITVADDDDDQIVVLDIVRPLERYVRVVVDRGTADAALDGIVAIQYQPRTIPTTHDATTVVGSETHLSPAEGTA